MSDQDLMMRATVFRPAGPGPFPLAVVSHGSHQSSVRRAKMPMPEYPVLSQWLVDRGYAVVLPQRFGHGQTGGPYLEDEGRCENPDYRAAGESTANAIQAAINSLTVAPFVRATDVLAIGHSAGGWGSLALAARGQTLTAVINIAGGRGGRMDNKPNIICASDRLVATAAAFGRRRSPDTVALCRKRQLLPASRVEADVRGLSRRRRCRRVPAVAAVWARRPQFHRSRRRARPVGTGDRRLSRWAARQTIACIPQTKSILRTAVTTC